MKRSIIAGICTAVLSTSLAAGPVITVDSAEYDIGIIPEGSRASVSHIFKVRNTGDSVLVIRDVRPG